MTLLLGSCGACGCSDPVDPPPCCDFLASVNPRFWIAGDQLRVSVRVEVFGFFDVWCSCGVSGTVARNTFSLQRDFAERFAYFGSPSSDGSTPPSDGSNGCRFAELVRFGSDVVGGEIGRATMTAPCDGVSGSLELVFLLSGSSTSPSIDVVFSDNYAGLSGGTTFGKLQVNGSVQAIIENQSAPVGCVISTIIGAFSADGASGTFVDVGTSGVHTATSTKQVTNTLLSGQSVSVEYEFRIVATFDADARVCPDAMAGVAALRRPLRTLGGASRARPTRLGVRREELRAPLGDWAAWAIRRGSFGLLRSRPWCRCDRRRRWLNGVGKRLFGVRMITLEDRVHDER